MSSMIFRRRDFDPDTGSDIPTPAGAPFCKTGQRRLYFTEQGLEYEQPVDDTDDSGAPSDPTPSEPIRIVDMGLGNDVQGDRSVNVGGGFDGTSGTENQIVGPDSVILGGRNNTVNGGGSVVVGGQDNLALASRSVVLGGAGITANVANAAFAQRLHTEEYLRLAVYADVSAIPGSAEIQGAVVYVSGVGLHVWDGSWQPV